MRVFILLVLSVGLIAMGVGLAVVTIQQQRRRQNVIAGMKAAHERQVQELEDTIAYHAGLGKAAERARLRLEQTNDSVADVVRDFRRERDAHRADPTPDDR